MKLGKELVILLISGGFRTHEEAYASPPIPWDP